MNTTCWIWISAHMVQNRRRRPADDPVLRSRHDGGAADPRPRLDAGASWRWILVRRRAGAALRLALVFLPLRTCPGAGTSLTQLRQVVAFNPSWLLGIVVAGFMYVGAEMTVNVWLPSSRSTSSGRDTRLVRGDLFLVA